MKDKKIAFIHIPKTGGTALEWKIFNAYRFQDPHFYFSFLATDGSKGKNWYGMPEMFESRPDIFTEIMKNEHFLNSSVISGHYSHSILKHFNGIDFNKKITILREPISRSISNICEHTRLHVANKNNKLPHDIWKFGKATTPPEKSPEYWEFMYILITDSITKNNRIDAILPHESMMITNAMTHMLGGSNLASVVEPNLSAAKDFIDRPDTYIADFSNYNETVQKMMLDVGLDKVSLANNILGNGDPHSNRSVGLNHNAPQKMIDLIADLNQADIELYDYFKKHNY
jgi:hypothetical protein